MAALVYGVTNKWKAWAILSRKLKQEVLQLGSSWLMLARRASISEPWEGDCPLSEESSKRRA